MRKLACFKAKKQTFITTPKKIKGTVKTFHEVQISVRTYPDLSSPKVLDPLCLHKDRIDGLEKRA